MDGFGLQLRNKDCILERKKQIIIYEFSSRSTVTILQLTNLKHMLVSTWAIWEYTIYIYQYLLILLTRWAINWPYDYAIGVCRLCVGVVNESSLGLLCKFIV